MDVLHWCFDVFDPHPEFGMFSAYVSGIIFHAEMFAPNRIKLTAESLFRYQVMPAEQSKMHDKSTF